MISDLLVVIITKHFHIINKELTHIRPDDVRTTAMNAMILILQNKRNAYIKAWRGLTRCPSVVDTGNAYFDVLV